MKKTASAAIVAVFAIGAVGSGPTGNYRPVRVAKGGGEVALIGVQGEARTKANAYMTQQCGGAYEVVEEGEAVIGSTSEDTTVFRRSSSSSSSETTQKTEWRIKYTCKGAVAAPEAPSAPAGTPAAPAATPTSAQIHVVAIRL